MPASCLLLLLLAAPLTPPGDPPTPPRRGGAELQARIDLAVARGSEDLRRRLEGLLERAPLDYPVGRLALVATALVKAGAGEDDPLIARTLRRLEDLRVEKCYCASVYIFLLDALFRQGAEKGLPGEASRRSRMEELTRWLLAAQIKGHGSWSYDKTPRKEAHDFSNTQFAALALHLAVERGISVPRQSFLDLAALFTGAMTREANPLEATLDLEQALEARLKLTRALPRKRLRAPPGGWGYTDPRRGRGERDRPYPSMTAAGASSLAVALQALRAGPGGPSQAPAALLGSAEKALEAAQCWIAAHLDELLGDQRDIFYTLYSLEKVGDLTRVEAYNGRVWYVEGAELILSKQKPGGGWGTYVDTSLAILFLTRASRAFEPGAPPPILTGEREAPGVRKDHDMVYLDRAGGFLSARALLEYAGRTRKSELVPLLSEILRNYAPDSRDELAPGLLELWKGADAITALARVALQEITSLETRDRPAFARWVEERERVLALEGKEAVQSEEILTALDTVTSSVLRARLGALARRRDLRAVAGKLIELLGQEDLDLRRRLCSVLGAWTGSPLASSPEPGPSRWNERVEEWRTWWTFQGAQWARGSPGGSGERTTGGGTEPR